jgi:hypothetical protein
LKMPRIGPFLLAWGPIPTCQLWPLYIAYVVLTDRCTLLFYYSLETKKLIK